MDVGISITTILTRSYHKRKFAIPPYTFQSNPVCNWTEEEMQIICDECGETWPAKVPVSYDDWTFMKVRPDSYVAKRATWLGPKIRASNVIEFAAKVKNAGIGPFHATQERVGVETHQAQCLMMVPSPD